MLLPTGNSLERRNQIKIKYSFKSICVRDISFGSVRSNPQMSLKSLSWVFTAIALAGLSSFGSQASPPAAIQDTLDLERFVALAIEGDVSYQTAKIDTEVANQQSEANDNLYRGIFSASPFLRRYEVHTPSSANSSSFAESGLQYGYTQFLASGSQIKLTLDQYRENTRSLSFAKRGGYTIGLSQSLWKNYFGKGDRLNARYFKSNADAISQRTDLVKRDSCNKAVSNYVRAWISLEKKRFSDEMLQLAEELFQKSKRARAGGQFGELDWLGVQSEYLLQKNLSEQTKQLVDESLLQLKLQVPSLNRPILADPAPLLQRLISNLDMNRIGNSNPQLEQLQQSIRALEYQAQAEESKSLPGLDFKIEKSTSNGALAADTYRDDDLTF